MEPNSSMMNKLILKSCLFEFACNNILFNFLSLCFSLFLSLSMTIRTRGLACQGEHCQQYERSESHFEMIMKKQGPELVNIT